MGIFIQRVIAFLFLIFGTVAHADAYKPTGVVSSADTYLFGVHPYNNPQDLYEAYRPIMQYLESKIPGKHFEVEASLNYADYEKKIAEKRFHFGLPNPAQTVASFEQGYHVIAKMTPDDDFRGLFIALANDAPATPKSLTGKTICFTSATALAATLQPLMWLHDQGVDIKTLKIKYVGSQFSSILNAWSGEFAACGSTSRFYRTWSKANQDKAKDIRVLWRTPPLPHNGVIARDDVPKEIADQVARALAGLDKDPAVDQSRFKIDQQHFEIANNAAYKPVVEFLKRYDAAIGLPASLKLPKSE